MQVLQNQFQIIVLLVNARISINGLEISWHVYMRLMRSSGNTLQNLRGKDQKL